jgi:hypothetical protein
VVVDKAYGGYVDQHKIYGKECYLFFVCHPLLISVELKIFVFVNTKQVCWQYIKEKKRVSKSFAD